MSEHVNEDALTHPTPGADAMSDDHIRPEDLASALQDRLGPASGRLLHAAPVVPSPSTDPLREYVQHLPWCEILTIAGGIVDRDTNEQRPVACTCGLEALLTAPGNSTNDWWHVPGRRPEDDQARVDGQPGRDRRPTAPTD